MAQVLLVLLRGRERERESAEGKVVSFGGMVLWSSRWESVVFVLQFRVGISYYYLGAEYLVLVSKGRLCH